MPTSITSALSLGHGISTFTGTTGDYPWFCVIIATTINTKIIAIAPKISNLSSPIFVLVIGLWLLRYEPVINDYLFITDYESIIILIYQFVNNFANELYISQYFNIYFYENCYINLSNANIAIDFSIVIFHKNYLIVTEYEFWINLKEI